MPQQPQETVTTEMAIPHEIDSHHMLPPSRQPGMNVGECGKGLNDRARVDKRSCRVYCRRDPSDYAVEDQGEQVKRKRPLKSRVEATPA